MAMETSQKIQLFLAHADDHRPVLDEGIPLSTALDAPAPEAPLDVRTRDANFKGLPDALPAQRWAIVAPNGPAGDRLLELAAPLRKKREEEQGAKAIVYRVDPGLSPLAAAAWMQKEYRDAVDRAEDVRPRYLLLLGGPDLISWDFQQMLGSEAFVGRLAFDDERGYEAYIEKALSFAEPKEAKRAPALFHAVQDGTRAMVEGYEELFHPCLALALAGQPSGRFDAATILEIGASPSRSAFDATSSGDLLLREAARAHAAMLFTMSHGAGLPKEGWPSPEEQRAHQGAMVLGQKGDLLTARDIARGPFLPGGAWFMFACYSAGTPAHSAYLPFLKKLQSLGVMGNVADRILAALPKANEKPFVAALPQAALANPEGPLAFIGHVDLAWSWSFLDYEVTTTGLTAKRRAERFQGLLQALVHGHRFGVAHHEIARFFRAISADLTIAYENRAHQALAPDFKEPIVDRVRRANLWMQRQDLAAYVLLGDPAARLPITRTPARTNPGVSIDADQKADAVLAILRGTESLKAAAARLGVSRDEIERWQGIFEEAGRAALAADR